MMSMYVCMCFLGVPTELPAQRPAGRHKGLVQRGATLGGSENPNSFETQTEGGQTPGSPCLDNISMYVSVLFVHLRTFLIIQHQIFCSPCLYQSA